MLLSSLLAGLATCSLSSAAEFVTGQKWQIVLQAPPDISSGTIQPADAPVWDVDMFDTEPTVIAGLKKMGKIVICYFSAGTYEPWRPDANKFSKNDYGLALPEWPDEHWLKTDSANVRSIMTTRIQQAAAKGCDAIDPDNTDGFANNNGVGLTQAGAVQYMEFLQKTAAASGMKTGLKNSQGILPQVSSIMSFAVNEQCAELGECSSYSAFLASGKPVFQIEYPPKAPTITAADIQKYCRSGGAGPTFSTVIKKMALDGWVEYCDSTTATTKLNETVTGPRGPHGSGGGGPPNGPPQGPPRTTKTTTTTRPTTTTTTTRPTTTTTTSRPGVPPFPTTGRNTTTSATTTTSFPFPPVPTTTTTTKPTTTTQPFPPAPPRPTTTTTTSRPPTSSPAPTTSAGGGPAGCTVAHWQQCGGQDYKGCTTCASGFQCKGVSPPYYYQCL